MYWVSDDYRDLDILVADVPALPEPLQDVLPLDTHLARFVVGQDRIQTDFSINAGLAKWQPWNPEVD